MQQSAFGRTDRSLRLWQGGSFILLLVSALIVSYVLLINRSQPKVPIESQEVSEIKLVVTEFWAASINGDDVKLGTLTTELPDDFFKMLNRCQNRDDVPAESAEHLGQGNSERFVTSADRNWFSADLKHYPIKWQKGNYRPVYYGDGIVSGDHAGVRVHFGKDNPDQGDMHLHDAFFLLHREKGVWRIFMIDPGSYLSYINKYFALEQCDQTPLTEIPWSPQWGR